MTDLETAMRELMKDIGKVLRPLGFKGSISRWRRVTPHGMAEISRWSNTFYKDGYQIRRFGLVCQAVPAEWWHYRNREQRRRGEPALPIEGVGGPLIVDHYDPTLRPSCAWSIRADPDSPRLSALDTDVDAVRAQLPVAVEGLARRVSGLIEPGAYLEELLAEPRHQVGDLTAVIVLLAGQGPSDRLEEAIGQLEAVLCDPGDRAYLRGITGYARDRAAEV